MSDPGWTGEIGERLWDTLSEARAERNSHPGNVPSCQGCHNLGGNWDCTGEGDPDECNCENCTGSDRCPECGR